MVLTRVAVKLQSLGEVGYVNANSPNESYSLVSLTMVVMSLCLLEVGSSLVCAIRVFYLFFAVCRVVVLRPQASHAAVEEAGSCTNEGGERPTSTQRNQRSFENVPPHTARITGSTTEQSGSLDICIDQFFGHGI
jgi:hypothetical protein